MSDFNWSSLKMNEPYGEIPRDVWNTVIGLIQAAHLTSVDGGTFERVFGLGTKLKVDSGGGSTATSTHPFKVSTRVDPGGDGSTYQAKVELQSSLLKSIIANDRQTITGLDAWFVFVPGEDFIWLEIGLDSAGVASDATIKSYGQGDEWGPADPPNEYGNGTGPFEFETTYDDADNPIFTQQLARIAIFQSTYSSVDPFPIINTQLLNTNLLMTGDLYQGAIVSSDASLTSAVIGIMMPKPYSGPYIAV